MTSWFARGFVTAVFVIFAAGFIFETWMLFNEFGWDAGFAIAAAEAQNFIFFPIMGVAVLFAFWHATVIAFDAYAKNRIPGGPLILVVGILAIIAASLGLSASFGNSQTRSPFEVKPSVLLADEGDGFRRSYMDALREARLQTRRPGGLTENAVSCREDLINYGPVGDTVHYCLATGTNLSHRDCCVAREEMRMALVRMHAEAPSDTGKIHRLTQPLKIGFLLTLLSIGIMLARRRIRLDRHYPHQLRNVAVPVLFGAGLMVMWPLMNAAFVQTNMVLVGDSGSLYRGFEQLTAILFAVWALALIVFAFRSFPENAEVIGQGAGLLLAAIGVAQYGALVSYVNRTLGAGADSGSITVLVVLVVMLTGIFIIRDTADYE